MKVLHIINSLSVGGAEKLILEIAPLMKKYGQIDILVLKETKSFIEKALIFKGFNVYFIGDEKYNIYNPFSIFKLIPFLKRYDIIHTHLFPTQYWVAFAKILSLSSTKLITTEHNTTNRRRSLKWFKPLDKLVYSVYKKIICISEQAYINQIEYIGLDHKTCMILNGVNISAIHRAKALDRVDLNLKKNDKLVIMVAGFRPQKDQETLIKAFQHLPASYKLLLVGDGELRKKCEKLVCNLYLSERVIFTGIRDDVPQLLKASDLVVMSSHYEGLSLSSIEGMSVNKPFIASDVPGLHEIVSGYGLLFEEGNVKQLATLIYDVLEDGIKYKKIAESCKKRAGDYDINKMLKGYIKCYISALNG